MKVLIPAKLVDVFHIPQHQLKIVHGEVFCHVVGVSGPWDDDNPPLQCPSERDLPHGEVPCLSNALQRVYRFRPPLVEETSKPQVSRESNPILVAIIHDLLLLFSNPGIVLQLFHIHWGDTSPVALPRRISISSLIWGIMKLLTPRFRTRPLPLEFYSGIRRLFHCISFLLHMLLS